MRRRFGRWAWIAISTSIVLGLIMQVPHLLYESDPRHRGVPIKLNSDEEVYWARVQEAISGRGSQSDEAFVGDGRLRGSQPAFLERVVGTAFRPTGLDAAGALRVMDSVSVVFLFLLLFAFLRRCRFPEPAAYGGALLFCLVELYNLQRPIHQGLSLVLLLAALLALVEGIEHGRWRLLLGGALSGLLLADYFWTWSFGGAWILILAAWLGLEHLRLRTPETRRKLSRLGLSCAVAAAVAAPFLWNLLTLLWHPLYEHAAFRSGMHPGRLPESWAYSVLFAVMAGAVLWESRRFSTAVSRHRYAAVTVLAAFVALNQQVVHGVVFNFASHYLMTLAVAAICAILLGAFVRRPALLLGAGAAAVYLLALAWDGRHVLTQFSVIERFDEQHLAGATEALEKLPRGTVLSDAETSMFVAGTTKHDVVYGLYLKNVLMSHATIARRLCMTLAPETPEDRRIAERMLVWPDANAALGMNLRYREMQIVLRACEQVDSHPDAWLRFFKVKYVLWDERRKPRWNLRRLHMVLVPVDRGDGWSLWEVPDVIRYRRAP